MAVIIKQSSNRTRILYTTNSEELHNMTTQTIIPVISSYTASIWIFQTCSSGRWDAGCRRRTYLWGPHHDRWSQQLNYILQCIALVGWSQFSCLPERNCNSVDQLLLLRIQHWGRGGVSPCKHARSSATLFDGKGARFITLLSHKICGYNPDFHETVEE